MTSDGVDLVLILLAPLLLMMFIELYSVFIDE